MLSDLYTPKQLDTFHFAVNNDYFMLINHGAKRTGKTVLDNDLFLYELRRIKKIAAAQGVENPQYILAGADLGALNRNVLIELSNKYGIEFHFDKFNRFKLFGVQVCCFGHSKINDLGRIRGMTAYGAYINEGTMAKQEVFDEIKSRCSGNGARMLIDTNPDNPEHWLKKDFIDKADGKIIKEVQYRLDDNTFLSERYKQNMKETTPSGMFYDRNMSWTKLHSRGKCMPLTYAFPAACSRRMLCHKYRMSPHGSLLSVIWYECRSFPLRYEIPRMLSYGIQPLFMYIVDIFLCQMKSTAKFRPSQTLKKLGVPFFLCQPYHLHL